MNIFLSKRQGRASVAACGVLPAILFFLGFGAAPGPGRALAGAEPRSWSQPDSLGSPDHVALRALAASRNEDGRLEIFAIGGDGVVYHRYQEKASTAPWSDWLSLGRPGDKSLWTLSVGRNGDGRLEVFALDEAGALWHRHQPIDPGQPWSDWLSLEKPGADLVRVVAATNADGRLEVFGLDKEGRLVHTYQKTPGSESWSSWQSLERPPDRALVELEAARNQDGRIEVFALDSRGGLWHRYQPPDASQPWIDWLSLENPDLTSLAVGISADGRLELFGAGGFGVQHSYQSKPGAGPWTVWNERVHSKCGYLRTEQDGAARLFLFLGCIGGKKQQTETGLSDLSYWYIFQKEPNGDLSEPVFLTDSPGGPIFPLRNKDSRMEVFWIRKGTVWHMWQE